MILYNAQIYSKGVLRNGIMIISSGMIKNIIFNPDDQELQDILIEHDHDEKIDCKNKIVLPGIIDIHSHLRDMDQSEKETFQTGTKAAGFSGITTVFNMPNTKPPAINANQVKNWMDNAINNIYINVGFISGVPEEFNEDEINKMIELGIIGFKIYPLSPLNGIDWTKSENIQKILLISSKYQLPIFIHPDWPMLDETKKEIMNEYQAGNNTLYLHDRLYPGKNELKYVKFITENYETFIEDQNVAKTYPIIHFCHISYKDSYSYLNYQLVGKKKKLKITFEVTPHHLLLSNDIKLNNKNFGKVLPPLRDPIHSSFLFKEFCEGKIALIGTDHAPHALEEKECNFFDAPPGFPGFETSTRLLFTQVFENKLSLQSIVKATSENPAKIFGLKKKGFIEEGFDADFIIIDKISQYEINPANFLSKAKFSPFEGFMSSVQIWKTFLRGKEVNIKDGKPEGKIIKREELIVKHNKT